MPTIARTTTTTTTTAATRAASRHRIGIGADPADVKLSGWD